MNVVTGIEHIGKESNRWEDEHETGENLDTQLEYGEISEEYEERLQALIERCKTVSRRRLAFVSKVSVSEIQRIVRGEVKPTAETMAQLLAGLHALEQTVRPPGQRRSA